MYRLLGWEHHCYGARRIKANRIIQELVLARIAQFAQQTGDGAQNWTVSATFR